MSHSYSHTATRTDLWKTLSYLPPLILDKGKVSPVFLYVLYVCMQQNEEVYSAPEPDARLQLQTPLDNILPVCYSSHISKRNMSDSSVILNSQEEETQTCCGLRGIHPTVSVWAGVPQLFPCYLWQANRLLPFSSQNCLKIHHTYIIQWAFSSDFWLICS